MMKKKFKRLEEFIDILVEDKKRGFFLTDPPITGQFAFDCLVEALLASDYYVTFPASTEQCNTVLLDKILRIYSKDYRKLIKKKQKELKSHEQEAKSNC